MGAPVMIERKWLGIVAVAVAATVIVSGAAAKKTKRNRRQSSRHQALERARKQQAELQAKYQQLMKQAAARAAAVQAARKRLAEAEAKYKKLRAQLEAQYRKSSTMKAAIKARDHALSVYQREQERIEQQLARHEPYQRLADELKFVNEQLESEKSSGGDKEKIVALVREKGEIVAAMARLRKEAVADDVDAASARAKYEAARKRVEQLRANLPDELAKNPRLNSALANVQQAKTLLAQALAGKIPSNSNSKPGTKKGKKKK